MLPITYILTSLQKPFSTGRRCWNGVKKGQHWTSGTQDRRRGAESQNQLTAANLDCSLGHNRGDGVTRLWLLTEQNAKLDVSTKKKGCPPGWQGLRQGFGAEQGWIGVLECGLSARTTWWTQSWASEQRAQRVGVMRQCLTQQGMGCQPWDTATSLVPRFKMMQMEEL